MLDTNAHQRIECANGSPATRALCVLAVVRRVIPAHDSDAAGDLMQRARGWVAGLPRLMGPSRSEANQTIDLSTRPFFHVHGD